MFFKEGNCCNNRENNAQTIEDHDHDHKSAHSHSHEHMTHPGTFESRGAAKKRKYDSRAFVVGIGKSLLAFY